MLKKVIKTGFEKMGFQIIRTNPNQNEFTMEAALQRCIKRGLKVNSVIDVGASDGRWSRFCINFLPDANYLLVEANKTHLDGLNKIKAECSKIDFILSAAGNRLGTIYFDSEDAMGGLASEQPLGKNCIEVPVTTIDEEIIKHHLKPPFLIKLDTHGFEVPILEGAIETLKKASLIIIETYNFKLTKDSLRYFEFCEYMKNRGFLPIEIVDFMLRKSDNSFWQMDTFFIPASNKEFLNNQYL